MKTIKFYIMISLLFLTVSNVIAQTKQDSIRVVQEALQMIHFPEPKFHTAFTPEMSEKGIADMSIEQPYTFEPLHFQMTDNVSIYAQKFPLKSRTTVVLIHGALASSINYNKMAGMLRDAMKVEVIAIDLRGHGNSDGTLGDVPITNQYAEDLDEILFQLTKEHPTQRFVLAGHSMGGGIILRYIETFEQNKVTGYMLFAPNLGENAPTAGKELQLQSNFVKNHLSRRLGIKMLNDYGIHKYNSLPVVFYNSPAQFPLRTYSFRSMEASVPKDYVNALRLIDKPFIVLAGKKDEVFEAMAYPALIKSHTSGSIYLIDDETHNGIRHNEQAMRKIKKWTRKLKWNNIGANLPSDLVISFY